jgi:SAM-dependent MidA family methyltransferase
MTDTMTPLELDIRRRIAAAGPMPVGEYMALCLAHPQHGYYVTRSARKATSPPRRKSARCSAS